jgi:hypothetical protein
MMPAGRPRTSVPEKAELIELGKDLLAWASEKKKGELRARWCEWYAKRHFFIRAQWKHMIEKPEFRPYYEASQPYLADKWIDGTINQSIAHRYLRIYDPELKEHEDIDADVEAARKANALKSETKAIEEEKMKVLEQISKSKKKPK